MTKGEKPLPNRRKPEYTIIWLAGLVGACGSLIVNIGAAYKQVDNIATEDEVVPIVLADERTIVAMSLIVTDALTAHSVQANAQAEQYIAKTDAKMEQLDNKLSLVLINQNRAEAVRLRAEYLNLFKSKCQGSAGLEATLMRLKRHYQSVAGEPLREVSCRELA
tara:strand:+ start:913 stop:1404 length:492 start_codon:yes stop_codon:yes gene_type:complete